MIHNHEIRKQVARIERLLSLTPAATDGDLELQAEWGRYLCILVAGVLENALVATYSTFAYGAASKPVADYVAARLRRTLNPKAKAFVDTARMFKPDWADDLKTFLEDNGRKEAIDSIMSNRHLIAHGKHSGISVVSVKVYLERSVEVIEFIEKQCNV